MSIHLTAGDVGLCKLLNAFWLSHLIFSLPMLVNGPQFLIICLQGINTIPCNIAIVIIVLVIIVLSCISNA